LQGPHHIGGAGKDNVRTQSHEFFGVRDDAFAIASPANVDLDISAVCPAQLFQRLLLFYSASTLINTIMFPNLPFDVRRDIAPVSGLVAFPIVLVAHPSVPAKTVAELIAHAKANPGKVTIASFGTGSASHLAGELFKMMAGINMVHIPYRGGAPMVTDLIAGQVQVGFDVMVTSLPHVRTGALRVLGVAGKNRFDMLPDVPTVGETVPGYEARTWAGVGVPKRRPRRSSHGSIRR
jgi:tripartite-type tricarboxylate transporter receptor subunit TctC